MDLYQIISFFFLNSLWFKSTGQEQSGFGNAKIGRFLSWLKDVAYENLGGRALVFIYKLEIGARL